MLRQVNFHLISPPPFPQAELLMFLLAFLFNRLLKCKRSSKAHCSEGFLLNSQSIMECCFLIPNHSQSMDSCFLMAEPVPIFFPALGLSDLYGKLFLSESSFPSFFVFKNVLLRLPVTHQLSLIIGTMVDQCYYCPHYDY